MSKRKEEVERVGYYFDRHKIQEALNKCKCGGEPEVIEYSDGVEVHCSNRRLDRNDRWYCKNYTKRYKKNFANDIRELIAEWNKEYTIGQPKEGDPEELKLIQCCECKECVRPRFWNNLATFPILSVDEKKSIKELEMTFSLGKCSYGARLKAEEAIREMVKNWTPEVCSEMELVDRARAMRSTADREYINVYEQCHCLYGRKIEAYRKPMLRHKWLGYLSSIGKEDHIEPFV